MKGTIEARRYEGTSFILLNQFHFTFKGPVSFYFHFTEIVIEARRCEGTSFILLKIRSQLAIHAAIISIICKAIPRM